MQTLEPGSLSGLAGSRAAAYRAESLWRHTVRHEARCGKPGWPFRRRPELACPRVLLNHGTPSARRAYHGDAGSYVGEALFGTRLPWPRRYLSSGSGRRCRHTSSRPEAATHSIGTRHGIASTLSPTAGAHSRTNTLSLPALLSVPWPCIESISSRADSRAPSSLHEGIAGTPWPCIRRRPRSVRCRRGSSLLCRRLEKACFGRVFGVGQAGVERCWVSSRLCHLGCLRTRYAAAAAHGNVPLSCSVDPRRCDELFEGGCYPEQTRAGRGGFD